MQKALAFTQRIMHNGAMRSHSQIIRDVGAETVADRTDTSIHTVRSWAQRDSIPAVQWAWFASQGHATLEELATYAAQRPEKPESAAA